MGSASLITDENGNEYQRLEYTPYGEVWVDKYSQIQESTALLPYKFTGKERDEETGLYYYGARYLDAKYSRWLSCDPALGEYMAGSKAGMGGAYNSVNLNLYHYAGNNPIKYVDPTGMSIDDWQDNGDGTWTVKSEGAKLWDVYGADWKEKSGFEGDPTKLHVGDTVGRKNTPVQNNTDASVNGQNSQGQSQNKKSFFGNDNIFTFGLNASATVGVVSFGGGAGLYINPKNNILFMFETTLLVVPGLRPLCLRLLSSNIEDIGGYVGIDAGFGVSEATGSAGVSVGVFKSKEDAAGPYWTIGGSGGPGWCAGYDVVLNMEGKPVGSTASFGLGVGSPAEGHARFGITGIKSFR